MQTFVSDINQRKAFELYQQRHNSNIYTNPCKQEFGHHKSSKSYSGGKMSNVESTNTILNSLFGSDASEWIYSDESLKKALELKIVQEKTKQEYYKVEALNRSIELMKLVTVAKVPPNLIPCVFGQPSQASMNPIQAPYLNEELITPSRGADGFTPPSPFNSPSPKRRGHMRGRTISNMNEIREPYFDSQPNPKSMASFNNKNENPMRSFKFGGGPPLRSHLPPKHKLSPSRIGAHAISSLDGSKVKKNINLQKLRHGSYHQRTLSLPASVSIPESKPIEFYRPSYATSYTRKSSSEIFIPDLTNKNNTVNIMKGTHDNVSTPKKRKTDSNSVKQSIRAFDYPKTNVSANMSTVREESGMDSTTNMEDETESDESDKESTGPLLASQKLSIPQTP